MLIVGLEIVEAKKYTESHEWVELDGNVGKSKLLSSASACVTRIA